MTNDESCFPKPAMEQNAIRFPNIWPAFVLIVIVYAAGFAAPLLPDAPWVVGLRLAGGVCVFGAIVYWFICLYRLHKAALVLADQCYPISPGLAVLLSFVPLFNFYWVFKWPAEMIAFVRRRTPQMKTWHPAVLGLLMLAGFLITGVSLPLMFLPLFYLSGLLKKSYLADPVPSPYKQRGKSSGSLIAIALCLGILPIAALFAAIAIPNFIMARDAAAARKCTDNLRAIENAKQQWYRDHPGSQDARPGWNDLLKYLHAQPVCPKHGAYSTGTAAAPASCSVADNGSPRRIDDDHILRLL